MICRLCLEDAEHGVPIFDQDPSAAQPALRQLPELIERHLQLVVSIFGHGLHVHVPNPEYKGPR